MAGEKKAKMVVPDWSSLPADLVNRVADCLLATNDLDYYMDLRAVCHHWRVSTADPKKPHDPRLFPTRWVMVEDGGRDLTTRDKDGTRLFVNSPTGRFVRRSLPPHLLDRDYHFVTSTAGGFLVLAEREPPRAARVLNPFTGCMIRFEAPVPKEVRMAADVVVGSASAVGDLHKLLLVSRGYSPFFRLYLADPGSERFLLVETWSSEAAPELLLAPNPAVRSREPLLCGLAAELAPGEMVHVERTPQQGVGLFRMDAAGRAMAQQVTSIGSRALFVGKYRCVSMDADRIPSPDANCIYYYKNEGNIIAYVYDLTCDKEERIGELYGAASHCPLPVALLLIQYTRWRTTWFEPGLLCDDEICSTFV